MTTIRHNRRKITVEETIYRDKMKDKLAVENGYKIIRIDCLYNDITTRYETIVENIKKSELSNIFNLERIDFNAIDLYCINNTYVMDAINLWKRGFIITEISNVLKLSPSTISRYLEIGKKHNLCEYDKNESHLRGMKKAIIRSSYVVKYNNINEVFSSISEMINYYNDTYNIKLSRNSIKRHSENNTMYRDRFFKKISHDEFNNYKKNGKADLIIGESFNYKKI